MLQRKAGQSTSGEKGRHGNAKSGFAGTSLRAFRHRFFMLYTLGNSFSLTGTWMQRLALGWLTWELTHSGFWLGVLAAADLLPVTVIGPVAGVMADRWNRLSLMKLTQITSGIVALALAALVLLDLLNVANLLVLAGIQGCMVALNQPSRLALVQSLVPRADVGAAVALSSVNVNLARITGPAIAGVMLVHFPVTWIFLVNVALTFGFVILLLNLKLDHETKRGSQRAVVTELKEGLVYTFNHVEIRQLLLFLFLGGVFLRSMLELAPAIAARSFNSGEIGLALLTSSMAAGAVLAGLLAGPVEGGPGLLKGTLVNWGFGALSACLLALAPLPVVTVGAMALIGFFVTRGLVGTQTFVQLAVPDAIRGRALSIHGLIARGSPALGALSIGSLSEALGLGVPILAGGLILLAAVALGAVPFSTKRKRSQGN